MESTPDIQSETVVAMTQEEIANAIKPAKPKPPTAHKQPDATAAAKVLVNRALNRSQAQSERIKKAVTTQQEQSHTSTPNNDNVQSKDSTYTTWTIDWWYIIEEYALPAVISAGIIVGSVVLWRVIRSWWAKTPSAI